MRAFFILHRFLPCFLTSSFGLKYGNFLFWSYEAEILFGVVFLSGKFEFLSKRIGTHQFDVKMMILGIFNGCYLSTLWKRGFHGNNRFVFKILPTVYVLGNSPKASRENLFLLQRYLSMGVMAAF